MAKLSVRIMAPTSPLSLPTVVVARAAKMLRGKRTGVAFGKKGKSITKENGMEDLNEFWNAAKTPILKLAKKRAVLRRKNQSATIKRPTFALPGTHTEADDTLDGEVKVDKYVEKALSLNGPVWSPSDLSRVSTLPPSPSSVQMSPPEATRAVVDDHEDIVLPHASRSSMDGQSYADFSPQDGFDMGNNNDDDDDNDLVPPPPPAEEEEEAPDMEETQEETNMSPSIAVSFPDDNGDHDNEGAGFHMVNDPETPENIHEDRTEQQKDPETKDEQTTATEKKRRGRRKTNKATDSIASRPKTNRVAESVAVTPVMKKLHGKNNKKVLWSPVGYQTGPREFKPVPISDYKDSPDAGGPRRSRRAKIPPLQFWKNERVEFGAHDEDGDLGDAMGCMPAATAVLQALPTPYKKRKVPSGSGFGAKTSNQRQTPFDNKKLKKQLKVLDGEDAHIWDEGIEDARDQKIISYMHKLTTTDLPLPISRKKSEGKVVGKAAQSFNIASDENDQYVGYIMGNLILPPQGIKDPESTGSCSQVFTVCTGQAGSMEVAFSDPHEDEGTLNPETAQRFLLGPGDQFRVPPGNCYRLQNHSKSTDCVLAWTIIRPRRVSASP